MYKTIHFKTQIKFREKSLDEIKQYLQIEVLSVYKLLKNIIVYHYNIF